MGLGDLQTMKWFTMNDVKTSLELPLRIMVVVWSTGSPALPAIQFDPLILKYCES